MKRECVEHGEFHWSVFDPHGDLAEDVCSSRCQDTSLVQAQQFGSWLRDGLKSQNLLILGLVAVRHRGNRRFGRAWGTRAAGLGSLLNMGLILFNKVILNI